MHQCYGAIMRPFQLTVVTPVMLYIDSDYIKMYFFLLRDFWSSPFSYCFISVCYNISRICIRHLICLTTNTCLAYHCSDVTMSGMASLITDIWSVCSVVRPGTHQRKHQSSASLGFVRGIHRWSVVLPHKEPTVAQKNHMMTSSCI